MILLPIGRDQTTIQRHAWISYSFVALNILMFVTSFIVFDVNRDETQEAIGYALTYLQRHPYLTIPRPLADIMPDELEEELRSGQVEPPMRWLREREQTQFDKLAAAAVAAYRGLPLMRFGYVPAENRPLTIVTSMFMHASLLHLLGNMLFFYVSGPFVEDVFGRPLFALLYFLGGFAATLTYWVQHPASGVPLVGASGAIAAVMGAYLVRFATSRIEFLFLSFVFRPIRFFMPAFVVLPMWFVQQMLEMKSEAGSGTAFSAHVGGFVFGAAFALVLKFTAFEEKHVAPKIQAEISWQMDPRLERAMVARDQGDYATAKEQIAAAVDAAPTNLDALRTAIEIARLSEDAGVLDTYRARLFTRLLQAGQTAEVVEMVRELLTEKDLSGTPKLAARATAFAEQRGHTDWAMILNEKLFKADPFSASAIGAMLKISGLRKSKGDLEGARDVLLEARAHPACTDDIARTIDARLAELSSPTAQQSRRL